MPAKAAIRIDPNATASRGLKIVSLRSRFARTSISAHFNRSSAKRSGSVRTPMKRSPPGQKATLSTSMLSAQAFQLIASRRSKRSTTRIEHLFLEAGGREYNYIPALNVRPSHLKLLTSIVSRIAHDWIEHRSETGHPLSKRSLLQKVEKVIGKKPSSKWYRRFLKHHPELCLGKPSGLDPKCAQCFNRATINEHFVQLG